MENGWQYSKVYKEHLESNGEPSSQWWEWALNGWNKYKADRYPMGKGAIPEYSYWDGRKYSYIEARKEIYIPLYVQGVVKTNAWKLLREYYEKHDELVLWDYDAYDHHALGMTLEDVFNDPIRKAGHGFVLALMLEKIYAK